MIGALKESVFLNLKNMFGPKTERKIVVFSVDDYGNVRLDSAAARANLDAAGLKIYSRFDKLDTLETKADLEQLYEVLSSVKDKNQNPAVFTPFALPCNIDFVKMESEGYREFRYETLPETYRKLASKNPQAYDGAWALWQEGIAKGLMRPQFHGREHLNLTIFKDMLQKQDPQLLAALRNRSFTSISDEAYPTMQSTAAFDFWDPAENEKFLPILEEGLDKFEQVYGYKSNHFTPPVYSIHHSLFATLKQKGIDYIDLGLVRKEHQGFGKYKSEINYTGKKTSQGLSIIVRNVVFEPTEDRGIDWIAFTMKQIEAAFRWNKPANISSHRVNFCGHIDPKNREKGLSILKTLLREIVKKWPDVEFMSADAAAKIITKR